MGSARRGADTTHSSQHAGQSHHFPKSVRLRKRREFLSVQNSGKKFSGRYFLALVKPRETPGVAAAGSSPRGRVGVTVTRGRVGVTVTKKVGNAVVRNRIKRMVREYMRTSDWLALPLESVIIARRGAETLTSYRHVARDLSRILKNIETHDPKRRRGSRRGRSSC